MGSTYFAPLDQAQMARRLAQDVPIGAYVNLGIGLPTLVANYLSEERQVTLHTENGMLGMGPAPLPGTEDADLINAGKQPVSELPGASYFHHADSFAMMRGGHLDLCVLGAFQVSVTGDLANWLTNDPDAIPAVGGAMDLAIGAKEVVVLSRLFTKTGAAKIVAECQYPLTAVGSVTRIYTDYGIFVTSPDGLLVRELALAHGADAQRALAQLSQQLELPLTFMEDGARSLGARPSLSSP